MAEQQAPTYGDIRELSRRPDPSVPTLRRLKAEGPIPYRQPGGKGRRVVLPVDALERVEETGTKEGPRADRRENKLPGPKPRWQRELEGER